MTNQLDYIVEHLFRKKSLHDVPEQELKDFISAHPYFAAGHFLLAKKNGLGNGHVPTTALYFNNAMWLEWLLQQDISQRSQEVPVAEEQREEEDEYPEYQYNGRQETEHSDVNNEFNEPEPVFMQEPVDNPVEETDNRETLSDSELSNISQEELHNEERFDQVAENAQMEDANPDDQPEISMESTEESLSETNRIEASSEKVEKAVLNALTPAKADAEKVELAFEPYHTIDYFASQGIRLQQSDLSQDKFGKQLKSFTEWLRSMKKLPNAAIESNLDEASQRTIQNIAEHSVEGKEIVTETMAEVWIKQGNKEKAIDILSKLSLQNPSKSHYFAAKIEQLKAL